MADEDLGTLDEIVGGTFEELASSLRRLVTGLEQIETAGLTRRTIVLLLHDATGIGKRDIEVLLDSIPKLADRYLALRFFHTTKGKPFEHFLGCTEMHTHVAPRCCRDDCPCGLHV